MNESEGGGQTAPPTPPLLTCVYCQGAGVDDNAAVCFYCDGAGEYPACACGEGRSFKEYDGLCRDCWIDAAFAEPARSVTEPAHKNPNENHD